MRRQTQTVTRGGQQFEIPAQYPTEQTGWEVEEPNTPFHFSVVPSNIKGSIVGDVCFCAGACALRSIPGVMWAWVKRTRTILLFEDGTIRRWQNPATLQSAVESYDWNAGLFPPGDYVLLPIGTAQRTAARRARTGYTESHVSRNILRSPRTRPAYAIR